MGSSEIGGFFGMEVFHGEEYHCNALRFDLARNALRFVLNVRKAKRVLVPDYSCNVVFKACADANVEIIRYEIDDFFKPRNIPDIKEDDYIYITNYFGQIDDDYMNDLCHKFPNIIVDNVQSFFSKPIVGADTIYSCRKFFGVPDGAYLYAREDMAFEYEALQNDCSSDRWKHIIGRADKHACDFYEESRNNETKLNLNHPRKMSKSTQNMLCGIDYGIAMERRGQNFDFLNENLKKENKLEVNNRGGYFTYPFLVENGVRLRNYLNQNNIYTPCFWPEHRDSQNKRSAFLSSNIVPLTIDHRYGDAEMRRIVQEVYNFIRE